VAAAVSPRTFLANITKPAPTARTTMMSEMIIAGTLAARSPRPEPALGWSRAMPLWCRIVWRCTCPWSARQSSRLIAQERSSCAVLWQASLVGLPEGQAVRMFSTDSSYCSATERATLATDASTALMSPSVVQVLTSKSSTASHTCPILELLMSSERRGMPCSG